GRGARDRCKRQLVDARERAAGAFAVQLDLVLVHDVDAGDAERRDGVGERIGIRAQQRRALVDLERRLTVRLGGDVAGDVVCAGRTGERRSGGTGRGRRGQLDPVAAFDRVGRERHAFGLDRHGGGRGGRGRRRRGCGRRGGRGRRGWRRCRGGR